MLSVALDEQGLPRATAALRTAPMPAPVAQTTNRSTFHEQNAWWRQPADSSIHFGRERLSSPRVASNYRRSRVQHGLLMHYE